MAHSNKTISEEPISGNFLVIFFILKCVSMVCGALGNLAVILYQVFMNKNKTPTSYLVVNLAVADSCACLTIYPTSIVELVHIRRGLQEINQAFFCKFVYCAGFSLLFVSTLTLLAISYDRYVFIKQPLQYPLIMTLRKIHLCIITIWFLALGSTPITIIYYKPTETRTYCKAPLEIGLSLSLMYLVIPVSIVFFLYYKIFQVARSQRRRIAALQRGTVTLNQGNSPQTTGTVGSFSTTRIKKELKSIKTFAIIIAALLFCLLPYPMAIIMDAIFCRSPCLSPRVIVILGDLSLFNSVVNPFIYGIRHKEYKNAYFRLLRSLVMRFIDNR